MARTNIIWNGLSDSYCNLFYIFIAAQYDEETAFIVMIDFQFVTWLILTIACLISVITLIPFGYLRVNLIFWLIVPSWAERDDLWKS